MDDDKYDEFGNYLGSDVDTGSEEDASSSGEEPEEDEWAAEGDTMQDDEDADGLTSLEAQEEAKMAVVEFDPNAAGAVVLHEDKEYYPEAAEVFPGAEILVQTEDTRTLDTPIVGSVQDIRFSIAEAEGPPETSFDFRFLAGLMDTPALVRNVALLGTLHSGKTAFMDILVQQTHPGAHRHPRYTDTSFSEQQRSLSIKASPMSLVLPVLNGKHFLFNLMDTPGHVNFSDEQTAALRLADGAVVVVDATEGVMHQTVRSLRQAALLELPVTLLITKVDRLIMELKFPPADAYFKLKHTVDEVNTVLQKAGYRRGRLSPELGNVCFGSGLHGWVFSLPSFAEMYSQRHERRHGSKTGGFPARKFARRLWGDVYMHDDRSFQRRPQDSGNQRTFIHFVLRPLYKIYSHTISCENEAMDGFLREIGVRLSKRERQLDSLPLLRLVLGRFFGDSSGFAQMLVEHVPSPVDAAAERAQALYTGSLVSETGRALQACDPRGPLVFNVSKLYPRPDASAFDAFGRVFSGTIRKGQRVRVLGESYSPEDQEDASLQEVTRIWVYEGRYRVEVDRAIAGNWVLLEGVDATISKTGTLADERNLEACIFRPLQFNTVATLKVAIEPINPSELPKMLDGLRKVNKTYPLSVTKAEESGEHIILGTGELYMDCILHDLRKVYSDIEIKVADPVVHFCETVVETSSLKCVAETPNKQCELHMIAEPLDQGLAQDIENGRVNLSWEKPRISEFFQTEYGWDVLASRSVWAFGPDPGHGPNLLVDDTLSSETDKKLLYSVKHSIVEGFHWSTREGPLCEEPIRSVKFKILGAKLDQGPINRNRHQIIPAARRVAYASFLLASPRLMEPVYFVEVQTPADSVKAVYDVLDLRRGHVQSSTPKAGSPLYIVHAYVPLIESFGFETDLRTHTQGQCMAQSVFDHWEVVPGDPLDKSIILRPLEPAPIPSLAREFMVKTRRRKGLSEDVSINKFFDDRMLLELARHDEQLQAYFQQQQ